MLTMRSFQVSSFFQCNYLCIKYLGLSVYSQSLHLMEFNLRSKDAWRLFLKFLHMSLYYMRISNHDTHRLSFSAGVKLHKIHYEIITRMEIDLYFCDAILWCILLIWKVQVQNVFQNAHCYVTGGFRAKVDKNNNFKLTAPVIAYAGIGANFVSWYKTASFRDDYFRYNHKNAFTKKYVSSTKMHVESSVM